MLCDHNTGQGYLRSPGKNGQTKTFSGIPRFRAVGSITSNPVRSVRQPTSFLPSGSRCEGPWGAVFRMGAHGNQETRSPPRRVVSAEAVPHHLRRSKAEISVAYDAP